MTKNKLKEKLNPSLHYLVDWSYSDMYKQLSEKVYDAMINNFTTNITATIIVKVTKKNFL